MGIGNTVDLDSNPTKLIEIVESDKALLVTRGALTTFSTANDVRHRSSFPNCATRTGGLLQLPHSPVETFLIRHAHLLTPF